MGIFKKSMRVIQGYTVVVEFFEIYENTENLLKLTEMDNSLHMYITVRKNERNLSVFMQQIANLLSENTIVYIKQP